MKTLKFLGYALCGSAVLGVSYFAIKNMPLVIDFFTSFLVRPSEDLLENSVLNKNPILELNTNSVESQVLFSEVTNSYLTNQKLLSYFDFSLKRATIYYTEILEVKDKTSEEITNDTKILQDLKENWSTIVASFTQEQTHNYLNLVIKESLDRLTEEIDLVQKQHELLKKSVGVRCITFQELSLEQATRARDAIPNKFTQYKVKYESLNNAELNKVMHYLHEKMEFSKQLEPALTEYLNHLTKNGCFSELDKNYFTKINKLILKKEEYNEILNYIKETFNNSKIIEENLTANTTNNSNSSMIETKVTEELVKSNKTAESRPSKLTQDVSEDKKNKFSFAYVALPVIPAVISVGLFIYANYPFLSS